MFAGLLELAVGLGLVAIGVLRLSAWYAARKLADEDRRVAARQHATSMQKRLEYKKEPGR